MADYNRFVSYVYSYENGVKNNNIGFAKVENRNGKCRIDLSLKNLKDEPIDYKIYMFIRRENELDGIYVGKLKVENSQGEFSGVEEANNIGKKGYLLSQIAGIIIMGDNNKAFGTCWDDEPLNMSKFKSLGQDEETAIAVEEIVDEDPEALSVEPEKPKAEKREIEVESVVLTKESKDVSLIDGADSHLNEDLKQAFIKETLAMEKESMARSVPTTKSLEKSTQGTEQWIDIMEKILDNGAKMYPFEGEDVEECVKLEPQDIGMLPMRCWMYGNNSFLLHSYYSYRHLILARFKDGNYVLGAPGINHNRERFMANMFGFKKFKSVRDHTSETCEFGYWYVELR